MKKIVNYIMLTIMMFCSCTFTINALEKEENPIIDFEQEINIMKENTNINIQKLNEWYNTYRDDLIKISNSELFDNIITDVEEGNISKVFDLLLEKLGDSDAALALENLRIDFEKFIDDFTIYENRLYNYFLNNSDTATLDNLNQAYDLLKSPFSTMMNIYFDCYNTLLKTNLDNFQDNELDQKLEYWYNELETSMHNYDRVLSLFDNKINSWQKVINKLGFYSGFNKILFDIMLDMDIDPYIEKMSNLFFETYDTHFEKSLNNVKVDIAKVTENLDLSIEEKNTEIYNKIELSNYNEIKNKVIENLNKLNLQDTYLTVRVDELKEHISKTIDKSINDLKKLLLADEYDILFKNIENMSDDITIDRMKNLIILNHEYLYDDFVNTFKANNGELKFDNVYEDGNKNKKIGTKSIVSIYQDVIQKTLYNVILKGDVRANGIIDVSDVTYMIKSVLSKKNFDEYEMLAGDINLDNKIDISDVTATIKKALS